MGGIVEHFKRLAGTATPSGRPVDPTVFGDAVALQTE